MAQGFCEALMKRVFFSHRYNGRTAGNSKPIEVNEEYRAELQALFKSMPGRPENSK